MITHDEVKETFNYVRYHNNGKLLFDYIKQQEKQNELLNLYRDKDELTDDDVVVFYTLNNGQKIISVKQEVIDKIKELEKELQNEF